MSQWASAGNTVVGSSAVTANSGTRSAALAAGVGEYAGVFSDLTGGISASTYTRFCFRLNALSGSTVLAQGRDAGGANLWEVDYDAGSRGMDAYFWNGARVRTNIFTAPNLIVADRWYCAEVLLNQAASGRAEIWLSGTSVGSSDGDFSAPAPYSRLLLWNNGATGTVYVDDVAVTSSYSGPIGAGVGA
jgi:hypothetical protein